jgi:LEA14-like dessication related protein
MASLSLELRDGKGIKMKVPKIPGRQGILIADGATGMPVWVKQMKEDDTDIDARLNPGRYKAYIVSAPEKTAAVSTVRLTLAGEVDVKATNSQVFPLIPIGKAVPMSTLESSIKFGPGSN